MLIFVRFKRYTDQDEEIAEENFPHLDYDPELQLLEQFKAELYENQELRGHWNSIDSRVVTDLVIEGQGASPTQIQFVWVKFTWNKSLREFAEAIQRCFDVHGMSGWWNIIDACGLTNIIDIPSIEQACKGL